MPPRAGLIDFTAERQRHVQFVGREALLDRLDHLLVAGSTDRWVLVTGGPGMGKSALLAAWLARRMAVGAAVPHHFIRRGEYDWDDPTMLVGSLVAQIEARFPDQREPDADTRMHPAARLAAMLRRISESELLPRGERLVILIDGLDEYDPVAATSTGDPLAAFLPHTLPQGVSFVCASRPRHPYVSSLEAREGGLVQIDLDDPRNATDNYATVRRCWQQAALELGLDACFIDEAVARAAGNVQHAVTLQKHIAGLPPEQRRVEDIPRGLAALIERSWERVATDLVVVSGLGILCAAREAITLDELGTVASWTDTAQRRTFLRGAKELLVETRRPDGQAEYRLHHESIRSYVAEVIGTAALRGHHAALARRLATWPVPAEARARRYALRHALFHRTEAREWAEAWRLAADMSFIEAKCRELGVHEAEASVMRTAERCRASGDEAIRKRLLDLARALGRESHWLRVAPEATAALVWNRLQQSGWSIDDIDAQLHVPAAARFLRVRHVTTTESAALVRDLVGHSSTVLACAITSDGRHLISASDDHTLKIWDLETGLALAALQGHTDWVTACVATPNCRRIISASHDHTLKVWDLASGHVIATLQGHTDRVTACAVTPDGRRVISTSWDNTLKVWDLDSGVALATLQGHADWVTTCTVSPDGRRLVSGSDDETLKIWDLASGHVMATLKGHRARIRACAITTDSRRVVSASDDETLKVWNMETGQPLATLQGHTGWVTACAVTSDGRRVVSASDDETLKVWDLDSGRLLATFQGHADRVTACAVTPDGRRVVSASHDHTLKVWDLDSDRSLSTLQGHAAWVTACAVSPDGRRVVSGSHDHTLKIWDFNSGRPLGTLRGHTKRVTACAVTSDGSRVVSVSWDNRVKVWDLDSGRPLLTLRGPATWGLVQAVSPDGCRVVSAAYDNTLKIWDLNSGRLLTTLQGHANWVTACAMTQDGRRLVSASADKTVTVWDLESGRTLASLQPARVRACAMSPDGSRLVSALEDQTLTVWDLESGHSPTILQGHTGTVNACTFTPDGRCVASASNDNTLKVWDLESNICLLTHRGNAGYTTIIVTETGIVAGDAAGTVWFLDWPPSSRRP